jgi:hypothetical protein
MTKARETPGLFSVRRRASRPSPARLRGQKEAEQNQKARSLNDSRCQVLVQGDVHHPVYFSGVCK